MRVLIADDDPLVVSMTRKIVESAGHEIVAYSNGLEACGALEQGSHRHAILDWDMPGMTGPEICRQLQLGRSARFIYVIILTVKDAAGHLEIALESGASDFITKPFRKEDLLARIRVGQWALGLQAQLALAESQRLESIGRLAAGVAHEINTPTQYVGDNIRFLHDAFEGLRRVLVDLRGLLDAAKRGAIAPSEISRTEKSLAAADLDYLVSEVPRAIEQSLDGIARVSRIVRAIKEFSHVDSAEKVPSDLNQAIESTLTVATAEWQKVAELVTDLADDLRILKVALDFDTLVSRNGSQKVSLAEMLGRDGWYDPSVLEALKSVLDLDLHTAIRSVALAELDDNAILAEDVRSHSGTLLVARGQEVTPSLRVRLEQHAKIAGVRQPIRIVVSLDAPPAAAVAAPEVVQTVS